jgi:hypothetical protein
MQQDGNRVGVNYHTPAVDLLGVLLGLDNLGCKTHHNQRRDPPERSHDSAPVITRTSVHLT